MREFVYLPTTRKSFGDGGKIAAFCWPEIRVDGWDSTAGPKARKQTNGPSSIEDSDPGSSRCSGRREEGDAASILGLSKGRCTPPYDIASTGLSWRKNGGQLEGRISGGFLLCRVEREFMRGKPWRL